MKNTKSYTSLLSLILYIVIGLTFCEAQFLVKASNTTDERNFKWYEASDATTVLGTDPFYEVKGPGVYFATFDGTLCGTNATGYFVVTDCNNPNNNVSLDITNSVAASSTVNWIPSIQGDQRTAAVVATETVVEYIPVVTKANNNFQLPTFTVVCMYEAADLVDDIISVDEDKSVIVPIYDNDNLVPTVGSLSVTNGANGTVTIDENGTPNDPTDDIVTYTPAPNFNGTDSFDYIVCNTLGACSQATVTVEVLPILDALDDMVIIDVNEVKIIDDWAANDNDLPLMGTITILQQPTNATVVINDNGTPNNPSDDTFTFTPDADFEGTVTFSYEICDDKGNCSEAEFTVLVGISGTAIDLDGDGILNNFEDLNLDNDNDPATNPTDTDEDGIPDYLDTDSDNDGILDLIEAQSTEEYRGPSNLDENSNGIDDAFERNGLIGLFPVDTDGDNLPDYLDTDSDNDGVSDFIEAYDQDQDGLADVALSGIDDNQNGLDDVFEGRLEIAIGDASYSPLAALPNTDGDGESNYRDTDDDNDNILTIDEDVNQDGNYANDDSNGNGIPDYLDAVFGDDDIEVYNVITPNGDGVHDLLRIGKLEKYAKNSVNIYNRWGVLVFATKAYNTNGNVFDGTSSGRATFKKDNQLPVGTYFYIITYEVSEGNTKSKTGYLYINR